MEESGMKTGYVSSRSSFLADMYEWANENDYAGTLVWQVYAWYAAAHSSPSSPGLTKLPMLNLLCPLCPHVVAYPAHSLPSLQFYSCPSQSALPISACQRPNRPMQIAIMKTFPINSPSACPSYCWSSSTLAHVTLQTCPCYCCQLQSAMNVVAYWA